MPPIIFRIDQKAIEFTLKKIKEEKMRYGIDFWDMIDGWIGMAHDAKTWDGKPNQFNNKEDAIVECNKRQETLDENNKKAGEHYGVIDLEQGFEIYCPLQNRDWELH
jgi:hypothetical protein